MLFWKQRAKRRRRPVDLTAAVERLEARALLAATATEIALAQIQATGAVAFLAELGGGSDRQQVVAVLDTGLGLKAIPPENRWINPGEVAGDGLDNDGNGYVDDVSGWNFALDTADVRDTHGHGSRVASELVLLDARVKILPLKLGDGVWGNREIRDAIAYVDAFARRGEPIVAGNMSFGGGSYDPATAELLATSSVIWVAAAGNYGRKLSLNETYWPANYPDVISVAANVTGSELKAGYSNWGNVTVSAPGSWLVTSRAGRLTKFQGTSAAAPAVTGAISLIWRANAGATRGQVISALQQAARPNSFTEFGLIDVEGAARRLAALPVV